MDPDPMPKTCFQLGLKKKAVLKFIAVQEMLRVVEASLTGNETDQQQYLFLKKMVQILVELGSQLCAVWASKDTKMLQHAPDNFETYLQARLRFLA